jgi:hypothetical protein
MRMNGFSFLFLNNVNQRIDEQRILMNRLNGEIESIWKECEQITSNQ